MKTLIPFLILLFSFQTLFANGGPIFNSNILKSGQICFYNHADVKIIEEKINIKIIDDYAIYDVTYYFENNSEDTLQIVDYAFPVDYSDITTFTHRNKNILSDISYFEMYFDGQKIDVKEQVDINKVQDSVFLKLGNENSFNNYSSFKRKWFISQFAFGTKKNYTLNVKYKVKNNSVDLITTKDVFKRSYGTRKMVYDFSPASNWGDGVIDKITIQIDIKDIKNEEIELKGLENWTKTDGMYVFHQEYFKPENKYFGLDYTNVIGEKSKDVKINKVDLKYLNINSKLNCDYKNLNDINLNTNCYLKNIKDPIIFNFLKNKNAYFITILTGDYSSEQNFYDHGRAKKIRLEYEMNEFKDSKSKIIQIDTIITIPDFKYEPLNQDNFISNSILFNLETNIFNTNIIKAKITILETFQGKKYKDVCFTELLFNSQLYDYIDHKDKENK